jgi:hypothetical protein
MLKPEISIPAGLATGALVYGVFQNATPSIADIRASAPNDNTIASTERMASWTAAAVVGGVSLIAKDSTIFVVGSAMIIALAWMHRHANMVNPLTGKAAVPNGMTAMHAA